MLKILAEEILPEILLFVGVADFKDRLEALKEVALLLSSKGVVSQSYQQALIEREERYPTGFRVDEDLAISLPHAHVKYTLKPALLGVLLRRPIEFQCMGSPGDTVLVKALIVVAVKDLERSSRLLRGIGDLFASKSFSEAIKRGDVEMILKLFKLVCLQ